MDLSTFKWNVVYIAWLSKQHENKIVQQKKTIGFSPV